MIIKVFSFAAIAVLLSNVLAFAVPSGGEAKRQPNRLISLLPASDGIVLLDSKRFFGDALPRIMTANQPILAETMAKVAEIEARTGIDLKKFDQVAVGATIRPTGPSAYDVQTVAIASGDINAGALIAVAKLASKGTYKEEKVGERTIYVFSAKDVIQKTAKTSSSKIAGFIDSALSSITQDAAVSALDRNTLVLGTVTKVRETLEGKSKVSTEVSSLLPNRETAVFSFALRSPGGLSKLLPLDNDELGANIDSVKYITGSLDVSAGGAGLQMMARTARAEQASNLRDTLEGLQMLGGVFLGSSKRPDQQVYGRMVKNAKFEARGTDVIVDLQVPQSDIDTLIGGMK